MFIIIGGDGKEYGPVTVEQIRVWIAGGRANLDTRAKAVGTEEWRRVGDFAEFPSPESVPPVMGTRFDDEARGETDSSPQAAGIGARVLAALLNAFFYFLAMLPGALAMSQQMMQDNPQLARGGIPKLETLQLAGAMEMSSWLRLGLLAAILVQCVLLTLRGQNLGKLITNARVVRTTGEHAGFVRAGLLRFLVPVGLIFTLNQLPPLGFVFLFVDFCFIFRADGRCLHDLMAGTKVVRAS